MSRVNFKTPIGWRISKCILRLLKRFNLIFSHKQKIMILKERGLKLGKNVAIAPDAIIDGNFSFLVSIGDNSTIGNGVRILAHDSSIFLHTNGYGRIGAVNIKENCIIGSDSVILPGVTIGPNVIVAAGSVVNKDIPENSCVAGVPARYYSKFDDVMHRYEEGIKNGYVINCRMILEGRGSEETKKLIKEKLANGEEVFMSNMYELADERNAFD